MAQDLFSIPIFFIVFREALEACIVIAVLLSLVEGIVVGADSTNAAAHAHEPSAATKDEKGSDHTPEVHLNRPALIRKLRIQIFTGAAAGLVVALAIGAAFIAIWFTQVRDLFSVNEEIWEGVFNLIASLLIFFMGLTMLRMDTAKVRWRTKLEAAFSKAGKSGAGGRSSKYILFTLPFITVLREGLEAVVFIGGVSLGQAATAIPIPTIVGLICGLLIGFIIYKTSSHVGLTIFLVISTNLLLLIGAGLLSKSVGNFQRNKFNKIVGGDVAEAGDGPGSYDVNGSIWHLNCCNPENKFDTKGWSIFAGLFGWSNDGNVGTVLAYIFYWWAAIVALIIMKYREGRIGKRAVKD